MQGNNLLKRNGYFRIGAAIVIVLAIAMIYQAFGAVLVEIYDAAFGNKLVDTPPKVEIIATGLAEIIVMLLGSMLLVRALRQDPIRTFRLQGFYETPALAYVMAIPLIFSAQLVGSMLAVLWEHLLKQIPQLYGQIKDLERLLEEVTSGAMGGSHTIFDAVILFVTIAIVPALSEEIVFRGFMQTNIELSSKRAPRPMVAILWTSVAFAAIHFEPVEFPGLLVLGLVLGWMSYRTGNLLVGSVGHVANNGAIVLVMLLIPPGAEGLHGASLTETDTSIAQALTTLALALPVLGMCLFGFNRITANLTSRLPPAGLFDDPDGFLEATDHDQQQFS